MDLGGVGFIVLQEACLVRLRGIGSKHSARLQVYTPSRNAKDPAPPQGSGGKPISSLWHMKPMYRLPLSSLSAGTARIARERGCGEQRVR
jgi:hypothetical protein